MTPPQSKDVVRAVTLSLVIVLSATVITVPLSEDASAAVNDDSLTVTEDVVTSNGKINVSGKLDTTGATTDVAFRLEDSNGNAAFVEKSVTTDGSGNFDAEIDLSNLDRTLAEGEITVSADESGGYFENQDSTTFTIDNTRPDVAKIDDIAEPTASPNITGDVSDDNLDTVHIAIRNSSGYYYDNGTDQWVNGKDWISTTVSGDRWYYNTSDLQSSLSDGEYDVFLNASDEADNNASYFTTPNFDDDLVLERSFTLDTTDPVFDQAVSVTDETDGDGAVQVGDTVSVSTNVSDATTGVESVTVNASTLTANSSIPMSVASTGDATTTYEAEVNVSAPTVSDGSYDLTVTAEDANGNTNTDKDSIDLVTDVGSVDSLTLRQEFVGIVEDDNTTVRVTAEGITDPRGYTVEDKSVSLVVGDYSYNVTVSSGSIDANINPQNISDTHRTGDVTVKLAGADAEFTNDTVELVHEAKGLMAGYQIVGTPMDADKVVKQQTNSTLAYYPENESWAPPEITQAGSTYYISGKTDSARIGYVFSENADSHTRHLSEGYNLVTPTVDLNENSDITFSDELGSITPDELYEAVEGQGTDDPATLRFNTLAGGDRIDAYEGYYVFVESGEKWGVITDDSYAPEDGS